MTRRRAAALVAVWTIPSAVLLTITWWIYASYRLQVPQRLGPEARAAAMSTLRDAVDKGTIARPQHPELQRSLPNQGPVVVTIWYQGRALTRVNAFGRTLAAALHAASHNVAKDPQLAKLAAAQKRMARIGVDVVVARGPLSRAHPTMTALSLHPGLEGLGVTLDGTRQLLLLPDDLVRLRLLGRTHPLESVPELALGLDVDRADALLARAAALPPGGFGQATRHYWRFRVDGFVERPVGSRERAPLQVTRGVPPAPALTAENLRAAALAGGRYLVAHLAANGRYVYEVDLASGKGTDPTVAGPYSIPRHAGTTYFLAQLYRHTRAEFLREPIQRAFAHLQQLIDGGGCKGTLPSGKPFACVVDRGVETANLGSTALTVVALVEYQRATGDTRYARITTQLAEWILYMQNPDGTFAHLYDIPRSERDTASQLLYFSGEAALALARMHRISGEARYATAAGNALDALLRWYEFFAGGYFYGEEHWTCIASEAVWPTLKHDRYRRFCSGYARFLRRQQARPGDFPDQRDMVGAYGVSPFVTPHNTPAGSRTEAMISAYLLGEHHGKPEAALRRQIMSAMRYTLGQQVSEDNAWSVAPKALGIGGIPGSPVDRTVRIDYVQHVCSAMLRAAALLDPGA